MEKISLKSLTVALGVAACLSIPGFAQSDYETSTPGTAVAPGPATGAQTAAQLTDAEILGVVNAVDKHEINAAKEAMKKKPGAGVRDYAKMLREEHSANMKKTKSLAKQNKIKPASSQTEKDLRAKTSTEEKALASLKGAAFEKAYIDAMVSGHTEVLQMLDATLIPAAKNEAVKTHLTEVRGHVAAHLEQGKRLQEASAARTTE